MKYEPKSGIKAGKRNRERVFKMVEENPGITGVEIGKRLGLSLVTIYKHLSKLQED